MSPPAHGIGRQIERSDAACVLAHTSVVTDRDEEEKSDLMKDLVAIIYSFAARIYGLRRGRQKAKQAKEALCGEPAQ